MCQACMALGTRFQPRDQPLVCCHRTEEDFQPESLPVQQHASPEVELGPPMELSAPLLQPFGTHNLSNCIVIMKYCGRNLSVVKDAEAAAAAAISPACCPPCRSQQARGTGGVTYWACKALHKGQPSHMHEVHQFICTVCNTRDSGPCILCRSQQAQVCRGSEHSWACIQASGTEHLSHDHPHPCKLKLQIPSLMPAEALMVMLVHRN